MAVPPRIKLHVILSHNDGYILHDLWECECGWAIRRERVCNRARPDTGDAWDHHSKGCPVSAAEEIFLE